MELKPEFQQKNRTQLEAHLRQRATEDDSFRQALLSDPRTALKNEIGLDLPDDVELQLIEETSNKMALVLPPPAGELSDMELEAVAGGKPATGGGRRPLPGGKIGGGGKILSQWGIC